MIEQQSEHNEADSLSSRQSAHDNLTVSAIECQSLPHMSAPILN